MFKKYKTYFPELYLIASVLFYWFFTGTALNFVAIGLLVILGAQLLFQIKISGIIIASIFLLLNLFMTLALLSELREFNEFTPSFYELLIVGMLYLGLNIIISSYMIIKYIKRQDLKSKQNGMTHNS